MPATEATWRDQKKLHFLFAISGSILFFATIWMFGKDWDRQWKGYQSKSKEIQILVDKWKEESLQTVAHRREHEKLEGELTVARAQSFDAKLLAEFQASVQEDELRRYRYEYGETAPESDAPKYDFARIDLEYKSLEELAQLANAARKLASEAAATVKGMEEGVATILGDLDKAERELPGVAADQKDAKQAEVEALKAKLKGAQEAAAEQQKEADKLDTTALEKELAVAPVRATLIERLNAIMKTAKFREDRLSGDRKFENANLDKAKADKGLGVRDSLSKEAMDQLEEKVQAIEKRVNELTLRLQAASAHRRTLQTILKTINASEDEIEKQLADNDAQLVALEKAIEQKRATYVVWWNGLPTPGKKLLEAPILDAFNSPLKIDNLWSDGLVIDYNFKDVKRYDRCTTCHQLMEKAAPGLPDQPGFVKEQLLTLILNPPAESELSKLKEEAEKSGKPLTVEEVFGLSIAAGGLTDRNAISITNVINDSLATKARLKFNAAATVKKTGDVIRDSLLMTSTADEQLYALDDPHNPFAPTSGLNVGDVFVDVDGNMVRSQAEAERFLLEGALSKEPRPLHVQVRRGLANPYTSHPRLDLFVGSNSPHALQQFACTICHEGQGSATDFKWASHTPNEVEQAKDWSQRFGWFDNHHWIYPMMPERFQESNCLKCHHEVVDLEPSQRFPKDPAPKVVRGYNLIRKYGCYGCHDINGYDGPNKRIGPDLRLEPNVFAGAQQLKADLNFEKLSQEERGWIDTLIQHPDRIEERERVLEMLTTDKGAKSEDKRLGNDAHELLALFKAPDVPGTLRKPGPSLRFAAKKIDPAFMFDWITNPRSFRPSTRMPRVFGLWTHLEGTPGIHAAEEFEPIEVLSMTNYIQGNSQKFDFLTPPEEVKVAPSVARGKTQFQTRGCVACHSHNEFKDAEAYRDPHEIVQGPDLSNLSQKFNTDRNPDGKKWLYSWIKEPTRYHVRTVMPNLFLDPIEGPNMVAQEVDGQQQEVAEGAPVLTDPVADIVAFLTSSQASQEWAPVRPEPSKLDEAGQQALDSLLLEYLKDAFAITTAKQYVKTGIPTARADEVKGAERLLILAEGQDELSNEQKLNYLGKKSIAKYGCYGCHDIPGFEDAKPIGAGLSDWGRKDPAKLAFEHILEYLHQGHHGPAPAAEDKQEEHQPAEGEVSAEHAAHGHAAGEHSDHDDGVPPFFMLQLNSHNRIGFLWQKIREPRSYDWKKTEDKKYNDRLRMPQFPFNEADREAVMTFILGLVADPPEPKYLYTPNERQLAILEGQKVLEKFNCQSCHILEMEQLKLSFPPDHFGVQMDQETLDKTFPFMLQHVGPEALATSLKQDRRGLHQASLRVMPQLGPDGRANPLDVEEEPLEADGEYDPTQLVVNFDLWQPAVFSGQSFLMGIQPVKVSSSMVDQRFAARGGFLTRYLLPVVTKLEGNGKGKEAMGWLPPPLVGEGEKVQSQWLHEFLLEPYPIRPAVYLRMPKFNMTSEEATKLAKYFAAVDGVEHPYVFNGTRQITYLNASEGEFQDRLRRLSIPGDQPAGTRFDHAMNIVVSNNYCVKCHIVGDFAPEGEGGKSPSPQGLAPDLARVYSRLRPAYVREWIAKPTSKLPYTSMPVNIQFDANGDHLGNSNDQAVLQKLFPGTSVEQVDGLVDLLMNFDQFAKQRSSVRAMVPKAAPLPATPPAEQN